MQIVCVGGGPAGLYFALAMKLANPAHRITVVERNKPYDTFGWGVVFSDATLENMRRCDPQTASAIEASFTHWDDIELDFKGRTIRSGGHGFIGIGRKKLLNILQARCEELGVVLQFEAEVDSDTDFPDADLVVAADGINSKIRTRYADTFRPDIVTRPTATSGSAPRNAGTPSTSPSRRRNTAGSRPTSTSSTTRPAPSSSRPPSTSGMPTASTPPTATPPSPSANSSSPAPSMATA